jgi:hypothetical protein
MPSGHYDRVMAQPLVVKKSRLIPVDVDAAFRGTLPMPLPTLFHRWYGPIPPIKAVLDQDGEWASAGQTRTVRLVGGGSMREKLTQVDAPHAFAYTLTDVTGALAPLATRIEGLWSFAPAGAGTEVTWQRTIHPGSALVAPVLPVFARLWRGYARQALDELSRQLVPSATAR